MKTQKWGFILLLFIWNVHISHSQKKASVFRDSIDNAIDLSNFLTKKKGVLPVVMPITEPAVGYGAIGGGLFFIPKSDPKLRPDIIAAAGGITSNDTWVVGGGYIGFWKNDHIRYRGVVGYGDIRLNFYPRGSESVEINLNSFLFLQQVNFRIARSDFFLGTKYQLAKIDIPIFKDSNFFDPSDFESWNSGISIIAEFDNLNNFLSPTEGIRVHLSYDQNLEALGSTRNWGGLNFFTHVYFLANKIWIPALRVESKLVTGNPPFYARPSLDLRGIPTIRYQGDLVVLTETEQLFHLTPRWGILGFTGIGVTIDSVENIKSDEIAWNAGGGFRYLIARTLGVKVGADIARGPEDWAFYVTIGNAWLR